MRFAAIDIGSNAIRLLIQDIDFNADGSLQEDRIAYYRVPLRLGESVFDRGRIGSSKVAALSKTMQAFRLLMDIQEVQHFRACATSALRNADNRWEVIRDVESDSGISIDCISGEEEAELIFEHFKWLGRDIEGDLLCVDVGGGSTELSLLCGEQRVAWQSFKIGTVRMLNEADDPREWKRLADFLKKNVQTKNLIIAGTGGNINRYHKLARLKRDQHLEQAKLAKWVRKIELVPLNQRSAQFGLKSNRADVIVPAGKIYLEVLKRSGVGELWVPKVGLSDGIILRLAAENHPDAKA